MALFDVKEAEAQAEKELRDEAVKEAMKKIKSKKSDIAKARSVVANLEREYETLLKTIGADAAGE